jgi:hypothetical protein
MTDHVELTIAALDRIETTWIRRRYSVESRISLPRAGLAPAGARRGVLGGMTI